jgi:hypothetical protein
MPALSLSSGDRVRVVVGDANCPSCGGDGWHGVAGCPSCWACDDCSHTRHDGRCVEHGTHPDDEPDWLDLFLDALTAALNAHDNAVSTADLAKIITAARAEVTR